MNIYKHSKMGSSINFVSGDNIADDIPIGHRLYQLVLNQVAQGIATIQEYSEPDITIEQVRSKKNILLEQSDFSQLPDVQPRLTAYQKSQWLQYRQALRDFTNNVNLTGVKDINSVIFPVKPI